eukprot:15190061-Alexandrium_andersonii.AAC.1
MGVDCRCRRKRRPRARIRRVVLPRVKGKSSVTFKIMISLGTPVIFLRLVAAILALPPVPEITFFEAFAGDREVTS